jgi:hydroxymethylbilane synthase
VRDCLVCREGRALSELRAGAVVGTSSLRRAAQLLALRRDLVVGSIRGNVETRIRKVREGEVDATLLAAAGLERLGLLDEATEVFPPEVLLPAPGQGALAVQARAGDTRTLELLAAVDDADARAATTAERAFLRALGAGCTAPVGAHAMIAPAQTPSSDEPSDTVSQGLFRVGLDGLVASPDGSEVVRVSGEGEPVEVGERLARDALGVGARAILDAIRG